MDYYASSTALRTTEIMPSVSGPAIRGAQRTVGMAMSACLGMWFLPHMSGPACNFAEKKLVCKLLSDLGGAGLDGVADELFWFFRKKLLFLNAVTYIPFAGTAFQLVEVYALGQFTIHCATHYSGAASDGHFSESWKAIEGEIFSGTRVVSSYEEFTGEQFPENIKRKFIPTIDAIRDVYLLAERLPGVGPVQEVSGEIMRQTFKFGTKLLSRIMKRGKRRQLDRGLRLHQSSALASIQPGAER
jgi:hypothetical protein